MAISPALHTAILKALPASRATLSRRATELARLYGPMTGDEARWIIAHEAGVDLRKYGLSDAQLDRVRQLRGSVARTHRSPVQAAAASKTNGNISAGAPPREGAQTPVTLFDARSVHPLVARSSRRLFVNGHRSEAIHKAFQRINNRVKKLTGIDDDGQGLMSKAFGGKEPMLQMTSMSGKSETDEQSGICLIMMGAMTGIRNPRVHEDRWEPDNDVDGVLDALSFASFLHRLLDRCEAHRAEGQ